MDASFAPLTKSLCASINIALKWLLTRMGEIMFNEVLLQGELLTTLVAYPLLVDFVYFHVPFETILGLEIAITCNNITLKSLISFSDLTHF